MHIVNCFFICLFLVSGVEGGEWAGRGSKTVSLLRVCVSANPFSER